jgi:aminoglycoside 3-N-acetyltransferase
LEGYILLLGAPFDSNTSLHLSEYRVPDPLKKPKTWDVCIQINGKRFWTYYDDIENDCGDFPNILMDYMKTSGPFHRGKVGQAECYLIPQAQLVDYGVEWMTQHR